MPEKTFTEKEAVKLAQEYAQIIAGISWYEAVDNAGASGQHDYDYCVESWKKARKFKKKYSDELVDKSFKDVNDAIKRLERMETYEREEKEERKREAEARRKQKEQDKKHKDMKKKYDELNKK
tara:strand:- start:813 stop:1181 length:369 start_codon:yes stop_codon:yes gene_type:complete